MEIYKKILNNDTTLLKIKYKNNNISFYCFLKLLKYTSFVTKFKNALLSVDYDFFFEMSVIKNINDKFVIALMRTHFPKPNIDLETYSNYFNQCNYNNIVTFMSLSGKTKLICPCPTNNNFIHFRKFLENGDDKIIYDFFQILRKEALIFLKKNKILYMKTHGHGVNYFHFRLQLYNTYNNLENIESYIN